MQNAQMLFLPECCSFIGSSQQEVNPAPSIEENVDVFFFLSRLRGPYVCYCRQWPRHSHWMVH